MIFKTMVFGIMVVAGIFAAVMFLIAIIGSGGD